MLSFLNFKGGSGKTTSAVHTAQRLALKGYRVLAVDVDPQASLTTLFGFRPKYDFLQSGTLYDAPSPKRIKQFVENKAEGAIFQYISGFYNPRRRHSSLGGKSPLAFERKAA